MPAERFTTTEDQPASLTLDDDEVYLLLSGSSQNCLKTIQHQPPTYLDPETAV